MLKELMRYIASKHPMVWVTSPDEIRMEAACLRAGDAIKVDGKPLDVRLWSCASGMTDPRDPKWKDGSGVLQPVPALKFVLDYPKSGIFVLRDFHPFVRGENPANVPIIRAVREVGRKIKGEPKLVKTIIFLSPEVKLPPDLAAEVTLMRWPLPEAAEIRKALQGILLARKARAEVEGRPAPADVPEPEIQKAVQAARGLSMLEVENCFSLSLAASQTIDPRVISAGKKQAVMRSGAMTWVDPPPEGLSLVGGLDVLKPWLRERKAAFSKEAEAYGLPPPRGMLIVGLPGTGKSLVVKCLGAEWQMPVLTLSGDQISGGLYGESEAKVRKVMEIAEASAPCIVFIDECEKVFAGVGSDGASSGGVGTKVFGMWLTWMQERTAAAPVFVAMTANDVRALPAELMRKGRVDEIWFTDLPTKAERRSIWAVQMKMYKREKLWEGLSEEDKTRLITVSDGFTGGEIEACLVSAMYKAFADGGREVTVEDLEGAAKRTVPIMKTMREKLEDIRQWSKEGRATYASTPDTEGQEAAGRFINLENVIADDDVLPEGN